MPLSSLEETDEQVNMLGCDNYHEGNKQDDQTENKREGAERVGSILTRIIGQFLYEEVIQEE